MPRSFITEDDIEKSILKLFEKSKIGYNILRLDPSPEALDVLPDGTGRTDKKQCVLPEILYKNLIKLNKGIKTEYIKTVYNNLICDFTDTDMNETNKTLYGYIRNGYKVDYVNDDGVEDSIYVKLIDFDNPENNDFTAVSQMWIKGRYKSRRPDVLVFVNGLPVVFIELKKNYKKVEIAYEKNLVDYRKDIPNLFAFNQICVLSNGFETRMGSFSSTFDFFFEWLRIDKEDEKVDRKEIRKSNNSIYYFIRGLLRKDRLLDYIENFILFDTGKQTVKVIAKNHQYFGVNNLMNSIYNRKKLNGKLGVYWHTQGSGKSYAMVMFARKVLRKVPGNFSFLVITDRDDLDNQIYKTFIRTGVIGDKEECKPSNSDNLRKYLSSNKPFIFSLIHKFRYDKKKKYPVLTTRDDLIVMVDEAHRTEYADLAENMRIGLPNANFVAFTGTPLLGTKRLTNQWFGDYVSVYNFKQSVEDGATVPLFYSRRVPQVGLNNKALDDDIVDIIERNDLNERESTLVEDSHSKILEVIKRKDRLEKIAKDIAHHFPRRGYLGKGMVVCVDKFTAVMMYQLVKKYWVEEKAKVIRERNEAHGDEKKVKELKRILNYMNAVEMAVVISDNGEEDEKYISQGLDINEVRTKMNYVDENGYDIEDRFKDATNPFSLVFVCAMWLTGFDVKNLSTIYLDKPMKNHSLMQAIARANRVYPNKECGLIIDYINVFSYIKKALNDYATGDDSDDMPVKNINELIHYLDLTINEADLLLKENGYSLDVLLKEEDTEGREEILRQIYNDIICNKEISDKFKVITNLMSNLYNSLKPEIFETAWGNKKFSPLLYLNGLFNNTIDDTKIRKARKELSDILDLSVNAENTAEIKTELIIGGEKALDLSKINFDELKTNFKKATYKNIQIEDLKEYIEKILEQMINRNINRRKFSERYQDIINRYNSGANETEYYFEALEKLLEDLNQEQVRPSIEGLTESELEIYDLLIEGKRLSKNDLQKVKLASKALYKKIIDNKEKLLVVDWFKDEITILRMKDAISSSLDNDLPESYERESFVSKTNLLLSVFMDKSAQGLAI